MKILHYCNGLTSGGAEKLLTQILPLMKEKGHEVHLAYSNDQFNIKTYDVTLKSSGIKIYNLNISFYNPIQIIYLIRLMKKERYDIVHAHLFPTQYWLAFAAFSKPEKTKLVKTEHNVFNHRRKYPFVSIIEKIVYNRYSKIIAITDEVKLTLANWLKNENKIIVINNGINLQRSNNHIDENNLTGFKFNDDSKINLLMTARFNGIAKDQNTLIRAAKLLPERYHVYFAGEGELLNNSKKLAGELNIEDRIHFLGMYANANTLMGKVDLNVLSTNFEGLSGVALESLASGKPFIGSDVAGVNNIVPDNRFLFPAKNPEKLARKIKEVTESKKLASEMVNVATEYVKKFDIRLMVENYLKLYRNLI
jgi:glycosyltransferase involved in cell wall biosynthesis